MTTKTEHLISFVVPFYNEGVNVDLFHAAIAQATDELTYAPEFVYVNDGSSDDTRARLDALHATDPRVTVINLAHNRGHQIAITAGIDHAPGDAVVIMDADLQDPPAVALELIANTGDFRLMDRVVVEELKKYREHDRYLRGIVASLGFRQVAVPFDRDERRHGETHYSLDKMVRLAVDGVLGFSTAPLDLIARAGAVVTTAGVAGGCAVAFSKAIRGSRDTDSAGAVLSGVTVLSGVQMLMLGVLGAYVGRIHRESQDRPLYAVERLDVARTRAIPDTLTPNALASLPAFIPAA